MNTARKGSVFERSFAKELSLLISEGADPHIYTRRGGSGGSKRDKQGTSGKGGDIVADKHSGEWLTDAFCLELKHSVNLYKHLWSFMSGKHCEIDTHIEQALEAALPYDRHWMLIMKSNRRKILVITDYLKISELVVNQATINKGVNRYIIFPFCELNIDVMSRLKTMLSK